MLTDRVSWREEVTPARKVLNAAAPLRGGGINCVLQLLRFVLMANRRR